MLLESATDLHKEGIEMKKMKTGDYILTKDIPDQETLDRIRGCVRKMGYPVGKQYGRYFEICARNKALMLDREGHLMSTSLSRCGGVRYTPQEIFAMVEEPNMKEDIKQTINRMKQEISTLEKQLKESEKEVTYKRGDRFYIGEDHDGEGYLLAHVDNDPQGFCSGMFCLVSIENGNRYTNPTKVADYTMVTVEEMLTLTNGSSFQLIEK